MFYLENNMLWFHIFGLHGVIIVGIKIKSKQKNINEKTAHLSLVPFEPQAFIYCFVAVNTVSSSYGTISNSKSFWFGIHHKFVTLFGWFDAERANDNKYNSSYFCHCCLNTTKICLLMFGVEVGYNSIYTEKKNSILILTNQN